jgi:glycosyltransferase involved in cell wall biosynthesis
MDVTLVAEGTYPHHFGGVSVWCDQMLRGLAGHRFHVVALAATGAERQVWDLPDNVTGLTVIPLWAPPQLRRRPGRAAGRAFADAFAALVGSVLHDDDGRPAGAAAAADRASQREFEAALRALRDLGRRGELGPLLRRDGTVAALLRLWPAGPDWATPTIADALAVVGFLESSLRPLAADPPPTRLTHSVANGLAALIGLVAKWERGAPFLLTEHGVYLRERYLGGVGDRWPVRRAMLGFHRRLCVAAYRAADLVTPGNEYNRRWEERGGTDPGAIRTVYNGVDPAAFPPATGEPDVPTVSWAGRIDPIKDVETLVRAFRIVHQALPDARLRLFGGTPAGREAYRDRCVALAAELGVAGAVTFEGRVDDIRDAYVAGHVVALTSISEGFPYTLIEAMTAGKPTVATEVGGVPEAVGDTGLVVPPRDHHAVAAACLRLLQDAPLRRRLGTAARSRALELFTVRQAIDTFDTLYRELVARAATEAAA